MRYCKIRQINVADLSHLAAAENTAVLLRQLRAPLLSAFDIYKSNVSYGVITEDPTTHEAVAAWYRLLLDLDERAFASVPPAVARYVTEEVTA